jgi:hypothetical protein
MLLSRGMRARERGGKIYITGTLLVMFRLVVLLVLASPVTSFVQPGSNILCTFYMSLTSSATSSSEATSSSVDETGQRSKQRDAQLMVENHRHYGASTIQRTAILSYPTNVVTMIIIECNKTSEHHHP